MAQTALRFGQRIWTLPFLGTCLSSHHDDIIRRQGVGAGRPLTSPPLLALSFVESGMTVSLCGISLPINSHSASQAKPNAPTTRSRHSDPNTLDTVGSSHMAPADPRYIPEVHRETARALSCGGIHCEDMREKEALAGPS